MWIAGVLRLRREIPQATLVHGQCDNIRAALAFTTPITRRLLTWNCVFLQVCIYRSLILGSNLTTAQPHVPRRQGTRGHLGSFLSNRITRTAMGLSKEMEVRCMLCASSDTDRYVRSNSNQNLQVSFGNEVGQSDKIVLIMRVRDSCRRGSTSRRVRSD